LQGTGARLAEQPGTGKFHHHLGLLSQEVEGEKLRGILLRYAPIRLNFLLFVSCISLVSYICMTSCYDVSVLFLFLAMILFITNTYIIMPS